ncbi:MAG: hypothetical protein M1831_003891 [Alyxoria varia]|nr:MAG: hypothetical protein M1831_003891 [Alyxoria varia]
MPLGALRKRASAKDLSKRSVNGQQHHSLDEPMPSQKRSTEASPGLLSPQSATSVRRPRSSGTPVRSSPPAPTLTTARQPVVDFKAGIPSKYASDPQLGKKFTDHASEPLPSPSEAAPAPTIGPARAQREHDVEGESQHAVKPRTSGRNFLRSTSKHDKDAPADFKEGGGCQEDDVLVPVRPSSSTSSARPTNNKTSAGGKTSWSSNILSRRSESSVPSRRSDNSSSPRFPNSSKSSPASSLFRAPWRKKNEPLFPLPVRVSPPETTEGETPGTSNNAIPSSLANRSFESKLSPLTSGSNSSTGYIRALPGQQNAMPASNLGSHTVNPGSILAHKDSAASTNSNASSSPVSTPLHPNDRSRASTVNSRSAKSDNDHITIQNVQGSGRNSTASTTVGRNSVAGLRSLTSRLRHSSEPHSPRYGTPGGRAPGTSNSTSFAMSRETLTVPEREEGETAGKYYARLEKEIPKKSIALVLSKLADTFSHDVLRSLLRTFKFYEEPMDMSMRKFLWEIDLPGEAQQIDRVMSAFSERYHECNPHIFDSFDEAYFVAYSLIILHSDLFNANNKHKMQRADYQKNTSGYGIPDEILGYFYDNIQYTEFIAEDADEVSSEKKSSKSASRKAKKVKARLAANEAAKNGKLDPYDIIIDDKLKLDILRPSLREELNLENTYSYSGTASKFDIPSLRAAFSNFGILQIVSARSRPEAFTSPSTIHNPLHAHAGVVDIKVAKVGTLWRKEAKKRKTRSPWQEWGAILTQSQLFLFKNASWVKGLVHQAESHAKQGNTDTPVTFKPPLDQFRADAKVSTTDAVALLDSGYKRHKHAFVLGRKGSAVEENPQEQYFEEVLLADNEVEMNDWIAKLNYAAAFRTANVRMQSWYGQKQRFRSSSTASKTGSNVPSKSAHDVQNTPQSSNAAISSDNATQGNRAMQKLTTSETEIIEASQRLDEHLRTARHLQILAPFPPKTRSELLAFGARKAHSIRWSRYDISRLKCQRDILLKEFKEDDATQGDSFSEQDIQHGSPTSRSSIPEVVKSDGSNSQPAEAADVPRTSRATKGSNRLSAHSLASSYKGSDMLEGIDEAFATPPETLSRFASSEGPFKMLPISYEAMTSNPDPFSLNFKNDTDDRPDRSISATSANTNRHSTDRETSASPNRQQNQKEGERPSSAAESEKEESPTFSGLENRARVRRSLQRTLREPREPQSPQQARIKKGKDAPSSISGDESASTQDNEGLTRKPGSFTVHGKKASVITFGSEWQAMSAEERLRLRRSGQGEGPRLHSSIETGDESSVQAAVNHFETIAKSAKVSESSPAANTDKGDDTPYPAFPQTTYTKEKSS